MSFSLASNARRLVLFLLVDAAGATEHSMTDIAMRVAEKVEHVGEMVLESRKTCEGVGCCPDSSCYHFPGVGCYTRRGATKCVGSIFQKGVCQCKFGACNAQGICQDAVQQMQPYAAAGGMAAPQPVPQPSQPYPQPVPQPAPQPATSDNVPGWSRLYDASDQIKLADASQQKVPREDFTRALTLLVGGFSLSVVTFTILGLCLRKKHAGQTSLVAQASEEECLVEDDSAEGSIPE